LLFLELTGLLLRSKIMGEIVLSNKILSFAILVLVFTSCRTVSPRAVSDLRHDPTGEKVKLMEAVSDLTDLYVFPSANKPGHIALVLNTETLPGEQSFFSDRVNYIFYLRELKTERQGSDTKLKARDFGEKVIMCWFQTPKELAKHRGSCSLPRLGEVSGKFGEVITTDKVGFYHGIRRDSYVANLDVTRKALGKQKSLLSAKKSSSRANVLSIVLEFNLEEIFGRTVKLVGIAAQSYTTSNDGRQKSLDRIGRPGVDMFLADDSPKDAAIFGLFKAERPFETSETNRIAYRERAMERLTKVDGFDQKKDWDEASKSVLAGLLVDDYLIIDAGKSDKKSGLFSIEDGLLNKKELTLFGGRALAEDSFGAFLKFLVSRTLPLESISGTPTKNRAKFPYLDEADLKWKGGENLELSRPRIRLED
jgi:hypothetical protein